MTTDPGFDQNEPAHAHSATARVLDNLELYGFRPSDDEPDPRPLPDDTQAQGALADVFDAFAATFTNTRIEGDLADLLWSVVNVFHRKIERVERLLGANEDAQKASQRIQDGSEIRSVELERLLAQGQDLLDKRDIFESLRDGAARFFEVHTGQAWRPRTGSRVNHRAMTATLIDSRDFIAAKRRAETEVLLPAGPRIAFAGGIAYNDHARITAVLDRVLAKHPGMALLHGGSARGAERIAACWAEARKIAQIAFKPDWTRHGKAAPFKRNDALLEALPIGLVLFPGSGISENLADKAKAMGIPVWRFAANGA